ncbi:unnamed protein product [Meganyctiphanes norvegica]|uniref:RanBP2-type domain-containing protein n=1 Tax=Meganyctiphanes norvegica TaxID=48144 RepID=A0AAV2SEQ3_MEGNR
MSKEISKRRKMCPICRKPHRAKSVTDLPMNVVVERLIRNMPKKLSLDTISSESGNEGDDYSGGTCSTHWKSAIYFFCETHSLHICRECTVIEHQVTKCKIVSIKEKIEIRKEDIIHQVNSAITAINDNISTINEYVKEKYKIISHQKIKIQHSKQIIEDATNTIAMEKAAIGKAQNEILKRNLKMLKMETLKFNLKNSKNMKTINDIAKSIEDVSLQYETLHKTNTNSPEVPMMKSEEWTCTTCMVINKNTKENCVICETPKPGPST